MSVIRRLLLGLASLIGFTGASRASAPIEFTDGSRMVLEPAHISFQPSVGWAVLRTKLKQKDTDTQICIPSLMRREGLLNSLLFQKVEATLEDQVAKFLDCGGFDETRSASIVTPSGMKIIHVSGFQTSSQTKERASAVLFFTLNSHERLTVVYYLGAAKFAEDFSSWFPATVRLEANHSPEPTPSAVH